MFSHTCVRTLRTGCSCNGSDLRLLLIWDCCLCGTRGHSYWCAWLLCAETPITTSSYNMACRNSHVAPRYKLIWPCVAAGAKLPFVRQTTSGNRLVLCGIGAAPSQPLIMIPKKSGVSWSLEAIAHIRQMGSVYNMLLGLFCDGPWVAG